MDGTYKSYKIREAMKKIIQNFKKILMASAVCLVSATASAAIVDINIDGVESWDGFNDESNTILLVDLGSGGPVTIDGVGWDVLLSTVGASWLSEATMSLGTTNDDGLIDLTVGAGEGDPGTMNFSSDGIISLFDVGLDDLVLPDGILRIQFYESFDDVDDEVDATYRGFISVSILDPVVNASAPSMLAIFSLALVGFGFMRRSQNA